MSKADYLDPGMASVNIQIPGYEGKRYEAMVPDTLDLVSRAELAINAMTRVVDPARDYELYFIADFSTDPPILIHEGSMFCVTKFLESLPLMRLMSGSKFNVDIDAKIMENYVHNIGKDGLYYAHPEGQPWMYGNLWGDRYLPDDVQGPLAFTYAGEGRAILAMVMWYQRDGNPLWKTLIERKISRLLELGYSKDGAIKFQRFYSPGQEAPDAEPPTGIDSWLPYGAIKYYQLTGYKPALELARGQTRHLRTWFDPDGRFQVSHFHLGAAALIDMLEYATAVNDEQLMDLVKKGYEQARSYGEPLVGFFPELPNPSWKQYPTCEGCALSDVIVLALKLTEAGMGDYWDDVDRYVRNQFVEMQMTSADWVERNKPMMSFSPVSNEWHAKQKKKAEVWPGFINSENVVERCVGSWASYSTGNDFNSGGAEAPDTIAQCCTGNAARTLYFVWDSILTVSKKSVRVNLLLNRASSWLDVNSYIPYEGRVDLKIKKSCNLEVRIPEWVKPEEAACTVDGKTRTLSFSGRYAHAGHVKKGQLVAVTFPISERTVRATIGAVPYTLVIKGNDVVAITPSGKWCPFYQRAHYRENRVRWVEQERFVSREEDVKW